MKKQETINNLYRILGIVQGVTSHRWSMVRAIVAEINSNKKVKVLKKQWADDFQNKNLKHFPLDLKKIETWSTFDDTCIELHFWAFQGNILCNVKIYDGESFGGHRRGLRFTADILLDIKFITHLESQVLYAFDEFAEENYEKFLEAQKKQWIDQYKKDTLARQFK